MSATCLRCAIRDVALLRWILLKKSHPSFGDGLLSGRAADPSTHKPNKPRLAQFICFICLHSSYLAAQSLWPGIREDYEEDPNEESGCIAGGSIVLRREDVFDSFFFFSFAVDFWLGYL